MNLEQTAISLRSHSAEVLEKLDREERSLEKFGRFAFGGFGVVGGLAIAFNITCAGQVRIVSREGNPNPQAPPFGCFDEDGNALGPDDYVIGFTRVYAYQSLRNTNPKIETITFDGTPVDPAVGISVDRCAAPDENGCPKHKVGVKLASGQRTTLESYQMKLIALGDASLFAPTASAGVMQPGTVKRREDQPVDLPPARPTTQPETKPAAQPTQPEAPRQDLITQAGRAEAANLMSQADAAFNNRRFQDALSRYTRIRNDFRQYLTEAQLNHVNSRIEQAQTQLAKISARAMRSFIISPASRSARRGAPPAERRQRPLEHPMRRATDTSQGPR